MTKKKGFLYKTLGGLVGVCSIGVIGALFVGASIEKYYTPTFDASRLSRACNMLRITIEARDIERAAAWDQCKKLVVADPDTKPLLDKMAFYENELAHPDCLVSCLKAGVKWSSVCDAIDARVDERINNLPNIREMDARIENMRQEISDLRRDSVEYQQWLGASKIERVKKNWRLIRENKDQNINKHYAQLTR